MLQRRKETPSSSHHDQHDDLSPRSLPSVNVDASDVGVLPTTTQRGPPLARPKRSPSSPVWSAVTTSIMLPSLSRRQGSRKKYFLLGWTTILVLGVPAIIAILLMMTSTRNIVTMSPLTSSLSTSSSSSSLSSSSSSLTPAPSPARASPTVSAPAALPVGMEEEAPVEYHLVFSTDCSPYQHWQSYVFFHRAMVTQQPGNVTRIASGCSEEDQNTVQRDFLEHIRHMRPDGFHLHFTPSYTKVHGGKKGFEYFNKPFGMKHWLENAFGFPNHPSHEDAIIVLLDPDMILMRPFTRNRLSNAIWRNASPLKVPRTQVRHGQPIAQFYAFGLEWKQKIDMTRLIPANTTSPVTSISNDEAREGYIVGPPYLATARDMYRIVVQWCEFAVPVYEQYPELLAEMYAYCLAAAHLQIPHQIATSLMVSDWTTEEAEGWSYVHQLSPETGMCRVVDDVESLPNVLHHCQRYALGPYFFGKRRLPKNFISCEAPLMVEPPANLPVLYNHTKYPGGSWKHWPYLEAHRHAFMICQLILAVNAAAIYYKQQHCAPGTANLNYTLMFNDTSNF